MIDARLQVIPARKGIATRVRQGQLIKVVNVHGTQVVDAWAFNGADVSEFMSMEHSRTHMLRAIPQVGDTLLTCRRRPILTVVEDTSGGVHDTLIAACDRYRYALLGSPDHDNCTDNLAASLSALGLSAPETPSPLNLFMNVPIGKDGELSFEPPISPPGSHVALRAEMDLVLALSACPQDRVPVNGTACEPTDAYFLID